MAISGEASTTMGRYLTQPTGFPAFIPVPHPHSAVHTAMGGMESFLHAAASSLVSGFVKLDVINEMAGSRKQPKLRTTGARTPNS